MAIPQQALKKALSDAGFLVFRTQGEDVVIAERVRENLIMDSGVRLRATEPLQVRIVLRVQQGHFPDEDDAGVFERVRCPAAPALAGGFAEGPQSVVPVV